MYIHKYLKAPVLAASTSSVDTEHQYLEPQSVGGIEVGILLWQGDTSMTTHNKWRNGLLLT